MRNFVQLEHRGFNYLEMFSFEVVVDVPGTWAAGWLQRDQDPWDADLFDLKLFHVDVVAPDVLAAVELQLFHRHP